MMRRHPIMFKCSHLTDRSIYLFINPQNISYSLSKVYSEQRVRGGYCVQYWGENLMDLKYDGITGSFGVEGLKQLMLLYRSEFLAFSNVKDFNQMSRALAFPAEMWTNIELHYLGWIFKGYFTNFTFDESVDRLGFFNYSLSMRITSFKNLVDRYNIFPWQYQYDITSDQLYIQSTQDIKNYFQQDIQSLENVDLIFVAGGF